jgi:hypothetical protein
MAKTTAPARQEYGNKYSDTPFLLTPEDYGLTYLPRVAVSAGVSRENFNRSHPGCASSRRHSLPVGLVPVYFSPSLTFYIKLNVLYLLKNKCARANFDMAHHVDSDPYNAQTVPVSYLPIVFADM